MIENNSDFDNFKSKIGGDDLFIHIIPIDNKLHSADNKISSIFIKHIKSNVTFYISINHPDSVASIELKTKMLQYLLYSLNVKWVVDKKSFIQLLNCKNINDINLVSYLSENKILKLTDYSTSAHDFIYRTFDISGNLNQAIPIQKHLELFEDIWSDVETIIKSASLDMAYFNINNIIIPTLSNIEKRGMYVDRELYYRQYSKYPSSDIIYSEYNLYTSTGRPSNKFNNINFAALNTTDGTRDKFISRYGKDGKMVLIDYNAFHPRIICYLTNYKLDNSVDIYQYLAKLYFQKQIVTVSEIKESKKITFRQLYGGIEDKYSHIKYLSKLKEYVFKQWEFFQSNGYVLTPIFNRRITNKHILEPNPYKLFNYILQAFEGEVAISRLKLVEEFLKNKKTMPVLYTYDSILYDFFKNGDSNLYFAVKKKMSEFAIILNKTDMTTVDIDDKNGKTYERVIKILESCEKISISASALGVRSGIENNKSEDAPKPFVSTIADSRH